MGNILQNRRQSIVPKPNQIPKTRNLDIDSTLSRIDPSIFVIWKTIQFIVFIDAYLCHAALRPQCLVTCCIISWFSPKTTTMKPGENGWFLHITFWNAFFSRNVFFQFYSNQSRSYSQWCYWQCISTGHKSLPEPILTVFTDAYIYIHIYMHICIYIYNMGHLALSS